MFVVLVRMFCRVLFLHAKKMCVAVSSGCSLHRLHCCSVCSMFRFVFQLEVDAFVGRELVRRLRRIRVPCLALPEYLRKGGICLAFGMR